VKCPRGASRGWISYPLKSQKRRRMEDENGVTEMTRSWEIDAWGRLIGNRSRAGVKNPAEPCPLEWTSSVYDAVELRRITGVGPRAHMQPSTPATTSWVACTLNLRHSNGAIRCLVSGRHKTILPPQNHSVFCFSSGLIVSVSRCHYLCHFNCCTILYNTYCTIHW